MLKTPVETGAIKKCCSIFDLASAGGILILPNPKGLTTKISISDLKSAIARCVHFPIENVEAIVILGSSVVVPSYVEVSYFFLKRWHLNESFQMI